MSGRREVTPAVCWLLLASLTTGGCVRAGFNGATDATGTSDGRDLPDQRELDGTPPLPCISHPDADTLLLYTFSGSGPLIDDSTGSHPGTIVGNDVKRTPGGPGCGDALAFASTTSGISYVRVDDHADWQLSSGSVDLWVNFTETATAKEGLLSRDAENEVKPGHLTIARLCDGGIVVRLQTSSSAGRECFDPLPLDTWHFIGVNFGAGGGLELWVNGQRASRKETVTCGSTPEACGQPIGAGIAGNNNPWILGAAGWASLEGSAEPVASPFRGMIDSVRISRARRDYATP